MSEHQNQEVPQADTRPADDAEPQDEVRATRQRQLDDDYQWARRDPQVHRQFGGQVVAVYQHQVLGAGRDHEIAYRTARRRSDCPSGKHLAYAVIPYFVAALGNEYDWCLKDEAIQKRYGGLVAAVHGRNILGAGNDREQAWRIAQMHSCCPAVIEVRFVAIPYILNDDDSQ